MPLGLAGQFPGQVGHVAVQAEQLVPHGQAEGDPARLAPGAAQVQPAGGRAERALELPFPAVVGVAVHRVVGKVGGRLAEQVEQDGAQRGGLAGGQRATVDQFGQVGQVGQGQAAVQQRRVGDLQLVAGLDQFGGRAAGDAGRGAEVALRWVRAGHGWLPVTAGSRRTGWGRRR